MKHLAGSARALLPKYVGFGSWPIQKNVGLYSLRKPHGELRAGRAPTFPGSSALCAASNLRCGSTMVAGMDPDYSVIAPWSRFCRTQELVNLPRAQKEGAGGRHEAGLPVLIVLYRYGRGRFYATTSLACSSAILSSSVTADLPKKRRKGFLTRARIRAASANQLSSLRPLPVMIPPVQAP